tara:strand:- start:942 stop:1115 length:174 start_codon:yes stop_codon:yes gene_type:complete
MVEERHDSFKFDVTLKSDNHEERIKILEEDIEALKSRPVATGGGNVEIDYSILASKD